MEPMEPDALDKALQRIRLTQVLEGQKIPFLKGRPKRETTILPEEIIDLKIMLNTCKSIEEFVYNC
jgi:hypothetical protein